MKLHNGVSVQGRPVTTRGVDLFEYGSTSAYDTTIRITCAPYNNSVCLYAAIAPSIPSAKNYTFGGECGVDPGAFIPGPKLRSGMVLNVAVVGYSAPGVNAFKILASQQTNNEIGNTYNT